MRRSEVEAVGELAGEALAAGGSLIKEMHEGIASRPFDALGAAAEPGRVIHDGVSRAVYAGVQGGLRGMAQAGARLGSLSADEQSPDLASRFVPSLVVGAVNGFHGDHLEQRDNALTVGMGLRERGAEVPVDPEALRSTYPHAGGRVAVFVHGLCGTEATWWLPARGAAGADRRSYGERLDTDLGFTALYVRYNTGRHISDNGQGLATLLEQVLQAWPVPVQELVLVGHSMGGLVVRSACYYGERDEHTWTQAVKHVFCLGSPHLGADLEKGANALSWALRRLPETRAISTLLNSRSVGIKDLRYGACVEEDWSDCDPDEFLRDRCGEVPFLPEASYYFIGATLKPKQVGRLLGDVLVRSPSASGRGNGKGRRIPFEMDNGLELEGLNHLDLLCHQAVYDQLRGWITREEALGGCRRTA